MTATALTAAPDIPDAAGIPLSERGPATVRVVVSFGFWLFLLSDIVVFSALFAAYAVLRDQTAGGPSGADLVDLRHVFVETSCLLASSFTCGLCVLAAGRQAKFTLYAWSAVTFLLGVSFLALEISEFAGMISKGIGPTRSAFLSAFFTLVGTHGIHVASGLCALLILMAQVATLGLRPIIVRRLLCFSLFWHALDLVWIGVFTIVYLGART